MLSILIWCITIADRQGFWFFGITESQLRRLGVERTSEPARPWYGKLKCSLWRSIFETSWQILMIFVEVCFIRLLLYKWEAFVQVLSALASSVSGYIFGPPGGWLRTTDTRLSLSAAGPSAASFSSFFLWYKCLGIVLLAHLDGFYQAYSMHISTRWWFWQHGSQPFYDCTYFGGPRIRWVHFCHWSSLWSSHWSRRHSARDWKDYPQTWWSNFWTHGGQSYSWPVPDQVILDLQRISHNIITGCAMQQHISPGIIGCKET